MEDLSRAEYPAMLANLQPSQASHTLVERTKRISRINNEIADWLQERRKVEEQYVAGLRKLLLFKVPNAASELGVFQSPWDKVLQSVDAIAVSHHIYATRIEKDVEQPLRTFHSRREVVNMQTFIANMQGMARELEDAQEKADKLHKKGAKANPQKLDAANTRLEGATSQWESQAPFIFESLQALDEQRVNHLRDVLTQLQTHEVDQATRTQGTAEDVLNMTLEISTADEIQAFAQRTTAGKPKIERRGAPTGGGAAVGPPPTRQSSHTAASSNLRPPSSGGGHEDDMSEHSVRNEPHPEQPKLRSRIGTMLSRRRQSIHGGFGQLSPSKNAPAFGRVGSSHGRISPRTSSHNLAESTRLSSLAETPDSPNRPTEPSEGREKPSHEGTNGVTSSDGPADASEKSGGGGLINGSTAEDIFDAPPGPPPGHQAAATTTGGGEPVKDAEGFTVRAPMNDPISQAQKEAAAEDESGSQFFKLSIQKESVAEEDADAKQAAISNVTSTLSAAMPSRKTGTVRGRRDVRNTIYMPAPPLPDMGAAVAALPPAAAASVPSPATSTSTAGPPATIAENPFPPSPPALPAALSSRPSAVAALASEASIAATSDTQSVRSANSLSSLAQARHPELHGPGLNSSVIETVAASFEGGTLKTVRIHGEIAFSYHASDSSSKDRETIRINNFPLLEVIGPNRIFVSNTGHPDEFTLDTSHLAKTSPAFTYRLHSEPSDPAALSPLCPLIIKPAWKPTPDHKLGLLLQYRLNPAIFNHPTSDSNDDPQPPSTLTLHNLIFVATYEGRATSAQTRPAGTHLKEKHLVYWRLGDVTLSTSGSSGTEEWSKIVCRVLGAPDADLQPGHVEARWEFTPPERNQQLRVSVSRMLEDKGKGKAVTVEDEDEEDPFADDNPVSPRPDESRRWEDVPLVRKVVSGRYEAK